MTSEKDLVRKAPETWCAGKGIICGYYNLRKQFLSAVSEYMDNHKLTKDDVIGISGIGCSGRFTVWQDVMTVHATHGNASNIAQGIALARETNNKKGLVYAVSGDGDALAIGRSNFQNLCSSNSNLTYLILNNSIYAMTAGQTAPTTNLGVKTISMPYGNLDNPWDTALLALTSGATFIARVSSYPKESELLRDILYQSFEHKGTAVVEVISPCPTQNPKDKRKNIKELQKEYFDRSISTEIFNCYPFNNDNPVVRYLLMRDYVNKNYNKDLVKGIIYNEERMGYADLVKEQKKKVRKKYRKKLGNSLEKILKKDKVESF